MMEPGPYSADMPLADAVLRDPGNVFILEELGCVGCPAMADESIAEACATHGVEVEAVLAQLNRKETP